MSPFQLTGCCQKTFSTKSSIDASLQQEVNKQKFNTYIVLNAQQNKSNTEDKIKQQTKG